MSERTSTLIRGGTLILPQGPVAADLRIDGDKITAIGPNLPSEGCKVIDAAGKLVFPGFIDTHTHFEMNKGTVRETADNWATGTRAALAGAPPACWTLPSRGGAAPSSPPWMSGTAGPMATPAATTAST